MGGKKRLYLAVLAIKDFEFINSVDAFSQSELNMIKKKLSS